MVKSMDESELRKLIDLWFSVVKEYEEDPKFQEELEKIKPVIEKIYRRIEKKWKPKIEKEEKKIVAQVTEKNMQENGGKADDKNQG